jgi:hypothetical protein
VAENMKLGAHVAKILELQREMEEKARQPVTKLGSKAENTWV